MGEHQEHDAIAKLKTNRPLTEKDIKSLEEILWSELGARADYEKEYGKKPLGEFVREIVGLDMKAAKEAFSAYLERADFDSRQAELLRGIVTFLCIQLTFVQRRSNINKTIHKPWKSCILLKR